MASYPLAAYFIIVIAFIGIAAGRLPRMAMNRATIALSAAVLLIIAGGISFDDAFKAIDTETIALLLAMMILVANLRLSGFFYLAGAKALSLARSPKAFLAIVIISSGFLSALFLNDTICIMLTPLVAEIARRSGRDGKPYLIALATAANAGSCATAIGNPQNMLIAAQSGIPFIEFVASLAPPSIAAMGFCYIATTLVFRKEFSGSFGLPTSSSMHGIQSSSSTQKIEVDKRLIAKSLAAAALLLILLALGLRTSVAALAAAVVLMITRRIHPERVFAEVDFSLLVFFSGLFILTSAVARTPLFQQFLASLLPSLTKPGPAFALAVTFTSNIVSNVPAVMLMSPIARGFASQSTAWLMLAMASTFAGNLTLLGSVANLIVAEQGEKTGIRIRFFDYLKVGLPVTIASITAGTAWLMLTAR
ncbi:MAG: anion transporter [Spirochaetales bacterium]|jgi:Na+/H+ antiporter NhaD/arsenite permease-like protein